MAGMHGHLVVVGSENCHQECDMAAMLRAAASWTEQAGLF